MATYLRNTEVTDIFGRKWTIDCLRMQLLQQNSSEVVYDGAGAIRFGEDGRLEYVLYDTKSNVSPERFFTGIELQQGEWLQPEHFYRLRATDLHDRLWTAEWLDADPSSIWGVPGAVVRGRIRELRCLPEKREPVRTIALYARTVGDIPKNDRTTVRTNVAGSESERFHRNVWTATTSIGRLRGVREGDVLHLVVHADEAAISEDVALRLEEAVSFVLGEQIRWTIEQEGEPNGTIVIRDVADSIRRPRVRPPIEFGSFEALEEVCQLLDRFLSYLIRTSPGVDKRHPLAVSVLNVLRASSAMLEDEALAVSVQVESVTRAYFGSEGDPDPSTIASIEKILGYIGKWDGANSIRTRVLNLVGNLKGVNAEAALRRLEAIGLIEERHWRAWRALRHPSAHGAVRQIDVRETVARCDLVFDLLLRLIFRVIGHTGAYSDHTTKGWPLRQMPSVGPTDHPFDPTSKGLPSGEVT
jgi:hypothetical protein